MLVRLPFFLITAYLLSEIKKRERRRRTLERVYFHDILNMITAVRGFSDFLRHTDPPNKEEIFDSIYRASDQVIDEIETQRALSEAEHGELSVEPTQVSARMVLERVLEWYRHHDAGRARELVLAPESEEAILESDPSLLNRVLGNMIKNAVEASGPQETVTAGCRRVGERVEFWVHNTGVIPKELRSRIFHADVSTKGKGRGLGTYSMKLLTSRLRGEVSFVSSEREGTTFRAYYPLRWSKP
jgi:signal transduction histidine kinase